MAERSRTLDTYRTRRDFRRTGEPQGGARGKGAGSRPIFVVQRHDARREHYDFRLELDGVLLSWAVTRGPSLDPSDRRLAVRTEDHPLDYAGFEGTIPKGAYGAGTVMIWDCGTWQPGGDPHEGLREGKLSFRLHGERMTGGWALVRMHGKNGGKREDWLLIKEKDDAADRDGDRLTARNTTSVVSGRSLEEIAAEGAQDS